MRTAGFNLVELVVTLSVGMAVAIIATPDLLRLSASLRTEAAAREVASALWSARGQAIRLGRNTAVKFRTDESGAVSVAIYFDGDGDGVSTRDIDSGVDPLVGLPRQLRHLGRGVEFGFPPGPPPVDPSDPRRVLDRLEDPIRFNRSDLASFNPLGGSTPGSLYLTDSRSQLRAVRVFGATGKVKILKYDRLTMTWR